jgi:hypothetical protein
VWFCSGPASIITLEDPLAWKINVSLIATVLEDGASKLLYDQPLILLWTQMLFLSVRLSCPVKSNIGAKGESLYFS